MEAVSDCSPAAKCHTYLWPGHGCVYYAYTANHLAKDMNHTAVNPLDQVLDPVSRLSEILFGLIMTLTFTGTFSVANAGEESVRQLLIAAIGCNLAWGLTDAVIYLIRSLSERGHNRVLLQKLQALPDSAPQARAMMAASMPPLLAQQLTHKELQRLQRQLRHIPPPSGLLWPSAADWRAAVLIFLLVSVATLPVVLPFVFIGQPLPALRCSNAIAIAMMFGIGWRLAQYAGARRPWLVGLLFTLFGAALVSLIIALGG